MTIVGKRPLLHLIIYSSVLNQFTHHKAKIAMINYFVLFETELAIVNQNFQPQNEVQFGMRR
jgi:hypothetical protein